MTIGQEKYSYDILNEIFGIFALKVKKGILYFVWFENGINFEHGMLNYEVLSSVFDN